MSLAARRSVAKSRRLSFWLLVLFALVINAVAAACALLGLLTMWLSGWSLPTLKAVLISYAATVGILLALYGYRRFKNVRLIEQLIRYWGLKPLQRPIKLDDSVILGREAYEQQAALPSDHHQLYNIVEELCVAAGLRVPKIYVQTDSGGINAFVVGSDLHNLSLVVTQGLLDHLNREQTAGVIAHEIAHLKAGDHRFNLRLLSVIQVLEGVAKFSRHESTSSHWLTSKRQSGIGFATVAAAGAWIATQIQELICHQREFHADASGTLFLRSDGVYEALIKIMMHTQGGLIRVDNAASINHFCFVPSLGAAALSGASSTHPAIESRLLKLKPSVNLKRLIESLERQVTSSIVESDPPPRYHTVEESLIPWAPAFDDMAAEANQRLKQAQEPLKNAHIDQSPQVLARQPANTDHALSAGPRAYGTIKPVAYGTDSIKNKSAQPPGVFDLDVRSQHEIALIRLQKLVTEKGCAQGAQGFIAEVLEVLSHLRAPLLSNAQTHELLTNFRSWALSDHSIHFWEYVLFYYLKSSLLDFEQAKLLLSDEQKQETCQAWFEQICPDTEHRFAREYTRRLFEPVHDQDLASIELTRFGFSGTGGEPDRWDQFFWAAHCMSPSRKKRLVGLCEQALGLDGEICFNDECALYLLDAWLSEPK